MAAAVAVCVAVAVGVACLVDAAVAVCVAVAVGVAGLVDVGVGVGVVVNGLTLHFLLFLFFIVDRTSLSIGARSKRFSPRDACSVIHISSQGIHPSIRPLNSCVGAT